MTLTELRDEYLDLLVGERIYSRVKQLVDRQLRRRDPRIYARESYDYKDALDDVVNDFVLEVLIKERQIDYILQVATEIDDFDRLISHHIRRFLARTRVRTVVDNLLDRSVQILREPPFMITGGSSPNEIFGLAGVSYAVEPVPSATGVRTAAALARSVPTDRSDATERAPRVYDSSALVEVLKILLTTVLTPVSRESLQEFFEYLLTAWLPSTLDDSDELNLPDLALSPEESSLVRDTAERVSAEMSTQEKIIFAYKFANLPDRQIADRLGLSRQSVVPRKAALMARLGEVLSGLDARLQQGVLAEVAARLALAEGGDFGVS